MIKAILVGLPLLFAWLKLRNISAAEVEAIVSNASAADVLWRTALIIYFFSWVWGTSFDVDTQELVYLEAPDQGRLPAAAIALGASIFCVGALLVWASSFKEFALALLLFTLVDHAAWRYLVRFLRPIVDKAAAEYSAKSEFISLEQLAAVERQVCGDWKWWRGWIGLALIAGMILLSFTTDANSTFQVRGLTITWGFAHSVAILFWVLFMEATHWYVRFMTRALVSALDRMREKYELVKRAA